MLRMMMISPRAADQDERFKAMMRDFVKTYANRAASTEDFKRMVEKHMSPDMDLDGNGKMDWFFNQYVYGTALPTYRFEHQFVNEGGQTVLKFKVTQSNVSPDFKMIVPIYIELANGRVIRLGAGSVQGNNSIEQSVPIKGLKDAPKRAIFAHYSDVLGVVENK
jgi:aminopeptidase N